jgi:hypothetical protein
MNEKENKPGDACNSHDHREDEYANKVPHIACFPSLHIKPHHMEYERKHVNNINNHYNERNKCKQGSPELIIFRHEDVLGKLGI